MIIDEFWNCLKLIFVREIIGARVRLFDVVVLHSTCITPTTMQDDTRNISPIKMTAVPRNKGVKSCNSLALYPGPYLLAA